MLCRERGIDVQGYDLKNALDFVALGTIADVVPLTGENRILVRAGLNVLNKSRRTGLQYIMERAGIKTSLNTYHVAFLMAPRFNAAGRLGKANEALRLLLTDDAREADDLSLRLEDYNDRRRRIETEILARAEGMLLSSSPGRVAVLEDPAWHTGIIGIVASRLAEKWKRPVILIGSEKDRRRGSGRSFGEFNLIEALETMPDLFESFGGHRAACGFSIKEERIDALRTRLHAHAERLSDEIFEGKIAVAAAIEPADVSTATCAELTKLEPFGYGNPKPVFVIRRAKVLSEPQFFKEKHVGLKLDKDGQVLPAVWYNANEVIKGQGALTGRKVDVAFHMDIDDYYMPPRAVLKVEDISFPE
jgi:single-stranded-DNA-specific exonuclease